MCLEATKNNKKVISWEIMAIMTINEVAKARSASWTGNYSLIWSGLIEKKSTV